MTELDYRNNDGIEIRLLWGRADDRVIVTVDDTKGGDAFAIEVRDGERPLDVFHHPFAYAAAHGRRIPALDAPLPLLA